MATIVKANYRHLHSGGRKAAVGSINYYAHCRDQEGEKVSRSGFSRDDSGLDTRAMRREIAQAEGTYLYRMVLAPGVPSYTYVDLKSWTRDVLLELEFDRGEFVYVGVEHRDQTEYAHVHVVMVLETKLTREDFGRLREAGTDLYETRRRWFEPSHELAREAEPGRERAVCRQRGVCSRFWR